MQGISLKKAWRQANAEADTNDLHALSLKAQGVFEATANDVLVSRADVVAAGLTAPDCALAYKLEWRRKREGVIYPGMTPHARKQAVELAKGNASIPRRAGIWRALERLIEGSDTHTGRLELATRGDAESCRRVALLHSRAEVRDELAALPILALDATMPTEIVQRFLPRLKVLADVQARTPHMQVTQVLGGWGKTSLVTSSRAANAENARRVGMVAELADFCRLHSGGNGLVVTYETIEDRFAGPGIRTGHFNAIGGLDVYGDVNSLFVIGRPLPDPMELRKMAMALTGVPVPAQKAYVETRGALMADGTGMAVNTRAYADPVLEALRLAVTDAEIIQAIGRGRGVNRTAGDRLAVYLLADVVLPVVVTRLVRWADIRLGVFDRMAARGLVLENAADMAAVYPDLFPSAEAARQAKKREECDIPLWISLHRGLSHSSVCEVYYRPAGAGQKTRSAWATSGTAAEAFARLSAALGRLVLFEEVGPEQQPSREQGGPEKMAAD